MKKNPTVVHHGRGVESFLAVHGADVTGVIEGFDRLRLRGSLRYLYQPTFMHRYLCEAGVLLKDFASFVTKLTERIRTAAHQFAAKQGRPVRYLSSAGDRKEELARALAHRDRIETGLIGVFDCVEPCLSYGIRRDAEARRRRRAGWCSTSSNASASITTFTSNTPSGG